MLQFLSSHKGPVGPVYFVINIPKSIQPLFCSPVSPKTPLNGPWLLLVSFWVPKAVSQILPSFLELYPDSSAPAVRTPGALMPISACSLYVTCLGILHIVGLGLGALC